jgi:hypothetical protein
MSTVYQAVDQRNQGAPVALKEFCAAGLPAGERAEALSWLAREAALLSTLAHPALPRLLAAFSEGDRHYVAMPFLAGETLEERIMREGPQPETLVLAWGRELASLLRYLHSQDPPVVHRDLKPANVLLRPGGDLTLLDLGVARTVPAYKQGASLPGTAVGTPGYAPPEQYQGLADERSDLYGLGATLHRALTGYDPERESPFRHPPVRDLAPTVSDETAAMIESLLALVPSRRPSGANMVLAQTTSAMRGAFARAYRPVHAMYRQTLILLALAAVLSVALYRICFGVPLTTRAGDAFRQYDPTLDPLRVLLVFAPGLLAFVPLVRPSLRRLARAHAVPRLHRDRAAKVLLIAWGVPLTVWLIDLFNQRWGDLAAVPGHAVAPAALAAGSIALAALGLIALRRDLRRVQMRPARLRWRYLAMAGVLALWPVSLAMQAPAFPGSCYPAITQAESQTQFAQVQALAVDRHNDLYVLDQNGLRERTADGQYRTLLDFYAYDSASPVFSTPRSMPQTLAVDADNHLIIGETDGAIYMLTTPGRLTYLARISTPYAGLAVARPSTIYFSVPSSHRIYRLTPTQRPAPLSIVNAPRAWLPEALASDAAGNLYVADAGSHAVERIDSKGNVRTIARLRVAGDVREPTLLSRDAAGALYTVANGAVFKIGPNGNSDTYAQSGLLAITAVAGILEAHHQSIYAVENDMPQPLFVAHEDGIFTSVGGTAGGAMHCDLPRSTSTLTSSPSAAGAESNH